MLGSTQNPMYIDRVKEGKSERIGHINALYVISALTPVTNTSTPPTMLSASNRPPPVSPAMSNPSINKIPVLSSYKVNAIKDQKLIDTKNIIPLAIRAKIPPKMRPPFVIGDSPSS